MDYKRNYEYVIAYCYDPNGKIDEDFKENIQRHFGKKSEDNNLLKSLSSRYYFFFLFFDREARRYHNY